MFLGLRYSYSEKIVFAGTTKVHHIADMLFTNTALQTLILADNQVSARTTAEQPSSISKFLQIFGGLVLGCIKTNFCKKICVRQHSSSSTRFAFFCTAAISKFSQNRFEKSAIFVKIRQKIYDCRKICKILPDFKNFSLRLW